jgi:hypothetical protein
MERFTALDPSVASEISLTLNTGDTPDANYESSALLQSTYESLQSQLVSLKSNLVTHNDLVKIENLYEGAKLLTPYYVNGSCEGIDTNTSIFNHEGCNDTKNNALREDTFKYLKHSLLLYVYCKYNNALNGELGIPETSRDCVTSLSDCDNVVTDVGQVLRQRIHLYRDIDVTTPSSSYFYLNAITNELPSFFRSFVRPNLPDQIDEMTAVLFKEEGQSLQAFLESIYVSGSTALREDGSTLHTTPISISGDIEMSSRMNGIFDYLKHSVMSRVLESE